MSDGFIKIAKTTELAPGKIDCIEINSKRYLFANVGGQYYVADDMCTHEDASLCTGSLHEHYVKCPLHGSRFDLRTGKAMDEPAEDDLRVYAVRIEGNDILAMID